MTRINGSYSYLTNDPSNITQRDTFDLVINFFADAAGTLQVLPSQTFTVSNSMPALTGTAQPAPGGPFGPGNSAFRTAVGFTSFNIDFIPPVGATFATFQFVIRDDGFEDGLANTGVSGVILDQIFINPEPGSMALFGLGGLGLGAVAYRRRKLKLAAKKTA
jgi:hypothetical protein